MMWTISVLTIPKRFSFLEKFIKSVSELDYQKNNLVLHIICNAICGQSEVNELKSIVSKFNNLKIKVFFNKDNVTIAGGRQFAINCVLTPLMAFIDDDCTLHGDVFVALEKVFKEKIIAFLGLPSYQEDTEELFKPRNNTPHQEIDDLLYMPIQGMFVAGYTNIFKMLGGFNLRRKFWGEWTEFNLRALRNGYPSAYLMDKGYIRHWHKAPESPTRNMSERELFVLWGLMCTAVEYKAINIDSATNTFWELVERRYLNYSFGNDLSYRQLFSSFLKLLPLLIDEWDKIQNFQKAVAKHRFKFAPFYNLSIEEYTEVLEYAEKLLRSVKKSVFNIK